MGEDVIVKVENATGRSSHLKHEAGVYKKLVGTVGIPILHWYGLEVGSNTLVLECLGPSLQDLFIHCSRSFTLKTTLLITLQLASSSLLVAAHFTN